MGLGGVISNLLSLGAKLLPAVNASVQVPSSSPSHPVDQNQIEVELEKLMRMLDRIKATLYDAEQREVTDLSVKLWLKELNRVAYDAEDVLDEYHYELLREQVEARDASLPNSRERKQIEVPYNMLDQIQLIRSKFDEIANDRIALQLSEGDGPKRCNNELIAPTSHFVVESNIFGREMEKEELIVLLSSECDIVSVVTIVGMGGIGKTTLAQLAYKDQRIRQRFDKFGWICVSEDFNVERLTKESVESITGKKCDLTNLSALQEKICKEISGKRVLLVLDDVWNENKSLWDLFQAPFISATFVKILVTTRNDHVAQVMQTEPTFIIGNLSAEQCWQLFEHFAFGGVQQNKDPKLVEIGKQIMNKCGLLPLAVKSIASLLRHEAEEESWRDILESDLWESNASNEIYTPLKLSYTRLPTYLKPCFLYCAMFPKDNLYSVEYLVKLWIYQGFIKSKGNKTAREIGFEYTQQLCQRSLFERQLLYKGHTTMQQPFKLHDIVHDLAQLYSKNSCYSIEVGKLPIFPNVLYHLYISDSVNLIDPIPLDKFAALRTLIIGEHVKNLFSTFNVSMAPKLRTLQICRGCDCEFESLSSVGNLKHLRKLSIGGQLFEMLPESISSLYNLRSLTLCTSNLVELPNNIGNLVSLEMLSFYCCFDLKKLPASLCQLKALRELYLTGCFLVEELPSDMGSLTNLQTLSISQTGISYLPPSLSKYGLTQTLFVDLKHCKTIGWLKDFPDLEGYLCLIGLKNIPYLIDVECANLVSMRNLKHLMLSFDNHVDRFDRYMRGNVFELITESGEDIYLDDQSYFSVMVSLQPHPNLSKLKIYGYGGVTFPEWIGSLCKLKYLNFTLCYSLTYLIEESLPLELEELEISRCDELVSMPGIENLKSLVKLSIDNCQNLRSFMVTFSYWSPLLGLTNLASLRSLKISNCFKLQVLADELLPVEVEPCNVEISNCPGLRDWCLQHGINYKDIYESEEDEEDLYETEEDEEETISQTQNNNDDDNGHEPSGYLD
ncbi:putative disease resistance protein RGA1 [Carex rostrata]